MNEQQVDLLVIGAGPAGLAAAISAARNGVKKIILVDRLDELGGILPQCIHNGFGLRYFQEELTGPEYAWRFSEMLAGYPEIQIKLNTMVIEVTGKREVITVNTIEGMIRYYAEAVILAMGCRERPRGAINIPGTRPAGVFTAGLIQRMMNIEGFRPGNRAIIIGSGDIGLIMARRLTLEGIKVLGVFEILPYSSGLNRNIVQCLEDFRIPLFLNHTVSKIYGEKRLTGVEVAPVDDNRAPITEKAFTMECDTLVLSVGLIPENELSTKAGVELDSSTGGPIVDSDYQTSINGIFACGNAVHVHDLVDDVSEEGKSAGEAAAAFLKNSLQNKGQLVELKAGRNIRSIVPQKIYADKPTAIYIRVCYPEWDVQLKAGSIRVKQRVVLPGETIHITIKPEDIKEKRFLTIDIEKGGVDND